MIRRPLFWAAFPFAAGILIPCDGFSSIAWGAIASVLLVAGLALTLISRSASGRVAAALCVLCGWGATGACAGSLSASPMPSDVASLIDRHADALAQGAEVTGRMAAAVTVRPPSRG